MLLVGLSPRTILGQPHMAQCTNARNRHPTRLVDKAEGSVPTLPTAICIVNHAPRNPSSVDLQLHATTVPHDQIFKRFVHT